MIINLDNKKFIVRQALKTINRNKINDDVINFLKQKYCCEKIIFDNRSNTFICDEIMDVEFEDIEINNKLEALVNEPEITV
jgi:hypothetical protein